MSDLGLLSVFLLIIATVAVSSAGPAFTAIHHPNPILKATWRLQVTFVLQVPLAIYNRVKTPAACFVLWEDYNPLLTLCSGISLGMHFSLWVWSLALTSLAESLLFVTVSPILIVGGSLILCKKVARVEIIGTTVGLVGCAFVAFGSGSTAGSSVAGDFVALLGSVTICMYMLIGRYMREGKKVALFYYLCPISFIAVVTSFVCSIAYDTSATGEFFGWLNGKDAVFVLYLGIVPGIIGHSVFNYLLLHVSALVVSMAVTLEPVIGSFIGWVFGMQDVPGWLIWVGGAAIIAGNIIVSLKSSKPQSETKLIEESNV